MNQYRIEIHGIDVTTNMLQLPSLVIRRGDIGAITDIGNISLVADNTNGLWTVGGKYSLLGDKAQDKPVKIYERDQLIYDGLISDIEVSDYGRDATIHCYTKVSRIIEKILPGYFDDQYTLAELSERMYHAYDVDTNSVSFSNAKQRHEDLGLQARVQVLPQSNTSLTAAQEWLARVGFCRHYFIGSVAHLDFVDLDQTHYPFTTFTNEHIINITQSQEEESIVNDGYRVETATGLAYQAGSNPVPVLACDETQSFVLPGIGQGVSYGDYAIRMSQRQLHRLTIQIKKSAGTWLNLYSTFQLTEDTNRYGIGKTFEVLSIDNSNILYTAVEAVSV